MSAPVLSIGPRSLATPAITGGPGFALSGPEWISIQTYSTNARALPITQDEFRKSLGPGAPADLSDFTSLIEAYTAINSHVTNWEDNIFPAAVNLASEIYQYGTTKAPVYYPPILKEAEILQARPDDEEAKRTLKAVLENLKKDANARAAHASAVARQIHDFASETEADQQTLVGADGKQGLVAYYVDKYGKASAEVTKLNADIIEQRDILKSANDEYDHDVLVAATTPTYAWLWPLGTVAAAVTAGIYGKRATDALDRARAAQGKINELSAKLAADANLLVAIHSAENGLNGISRDISAALPVIQKVEGVWESMSSDLTAISSLIDNDISAVPPLIMSLGVDAAITAWNNVAVSANTFRVNAYVKLETGSQSMEAWKVATQVASSRAKAA